MNRIVGALNMTRNVSSWSGLWLTWNTTDRKTASSSSARSLSCIPFNSKNKDRMVRLLHSNHHKIQKAVNAATMRQKMHFTRKADLRNLARLHIGVRTFRLPITSLINCQNQPKSCYKNAHLQCFCPVEGLQHLRRAHTRMTCLHDIST